MPIPSLISRPSDAILLGRAADGDVKAFELIHNRYRREALTVARRLCGRLCIAEDVVQEAFLAVWRRADSYSESRGSVRAWILTIVRHRAIDASRRQTRNQTAELLLDGLEEQLVAPAQVEAEADRRERARIVRGALRRLPPSQREAVVLTYFCGLTHHETATAVGRPLGTVKGRLRLGHERLRQDLVAAACSPS